MINPYPGKTSLSLDATGRPKKGMPQIARSHQGFVDKCTTDKSALTTNAPQNALFWNQLESFGPKDLISKIRKDTFFNGIFDLWLIIRFKWSAITGHGSFEPEVLRKMRYRIRINYNSFIHKHKPDPNTYLIPGIIYIYTAICWISFVAMFHHGIVSSDNSILVFDKDQLWLFQKTNNNKGNNNCPTPLPW